MKNNFFQTQKRECGPSSLFGQLCLVPATSHLKARKEGKFGGNALSGKLIHERKPAEITLPGL